MSDPKAPAATDADIYSYLFSDTAGASAVPPILSLQVARWANAPASGLKGVVAEIFQCWYDKDATGNAQPSWHHSLAKFTFDLAPNPAASATPDGKGSPPEMVISNPKLTTTYGRKGTALSKPVKADDADFIFSMGGTNTFPIFVPEKFKDSGEARNNPHLHGDAGKHRIGVELTAVVNKKTVKYSALDWDHTLRSTIQCSDPVDRMLALQTTPMGAFKTITDAKVVGRFSDPKRNPRVDPDKAPKRRYADLRTVYTAISRNSCATRGSSAGESSARSASSHWRSASNRADASAPLRRRIARSSPMSASLRPSCERSRAASSGEAVSSARATTSVRFPSRRSLAFDFPVTSASPNVPSKSSAIWNATPRGRA